jgi:hypothetical protein
MTRPSVRFLLSLACTLAFAGAAHAGFFINSATNTDTNDGQNDPNSFVTSVSTELS